MITTESELSKAAIFLEVYLLVAFPKAIKRYRHENISYYSSHKFTGIRTLNLRGEVKGEWNMTYIVSEEVIRDL